MNATENGLDFVFQ